MPLGDLLYVFAILIVLGLGLFLVNTYVPMAPPVKTVINVLAVVLMFLWLLQVLFPAARDPRLPRLAIACWDECR